MSSKRLNTGRNDDVRLLSVVALLVDRPEVGLRRGQVGTIVELLGEDAFEVEFSDEQGRSYAQIPLTREQFIVLHHRPYEAA